MLGNYRFQKASSHFDRSTVDESFPDGAERTVIVRPFVA